MNIAAFGEECCCNSDAVICGKGDRCPFGLVTSWASTLNKRPFATELLTALMSEMKASKFPIEADHLKVAAFLTEVLTEGQCSNGESMGKLRKALSHWGWIVIEPDIAITMANKHGIGHCTAEISSRKGAGHSNSGNEAKTMRQHSRIRPHMRRRVPTA